jgi:hypothetical protein
MTSLTIAFPVIVIAVALRAAPLFMGAGSFGVDQWIWRALIGAVRRDRRLPPELPQFLLEEKQYYPPLFMVLMARLPAVVFERYASAVAIFIDMLRLALVMAVVATLTGSALAVGIAGLVYALTPLLVSYNLQLNPRGLAALMLDLMVLALLAFDAGTSGGPWLLMLAALLAGALLMTHKMTTQLLVFLALGAWIASGDWRWLLVLPASVLAALLVSRGYYRNVMLAHIDIVGFWYRNWRWSGSNPILESPVYGEPGFESPTRFYRSGLRAWIRRLAFVIGFNPWVPLVVLLACIEGVAQPFVSLPIQVFAAWSALCLAFALLTTLVPALRCFGQGYLYGYNGAFPASVLMGLLMASDGSFPFLRGGLIVLGVLACMAGLLAFFRAVSRSRTARIDTDLDRAIEALAALPHGAVMCLPQHWHDAVAWKTGKPVTFGGHGYGFRLLQPFFPRLLVPVGELIRQYDVRYLLMLKGYGNARFMADLPAHDCTEFGDYALYRFRGAFPGIATPEPS